MENVVRTVTKRDRFPSPLIVEDSQEGTQTTYAELGRKAGLPKGTFVGGFANLDGDEIEYRKGSSK